MSGISQLGDQLLYIFNGWKRFFAASLKRYSIGSKTKSRFASSLKKVTAVQKYNLKVAIPLCHHLLLSKWSLCFLSSMDFSIYTYHSLYIFKAWIRLSYQAVAFGCKRKISKKIKYQLKHKSTAHTVFVWNNMNTTHLMRKQNLRSKTHSFSSTSLEDLKENNQCLAWTSTKLKSLVKETKHFSTNILLPCFFMVHDARRCRQHDESKLWNNVCKISN